MLLVASSHNGTKFWSETLYKVNFLQMVELKVNGMINYLSMNHFIHISGTKFQGFFVYVNNISKKKMTWCLFDLHFGLDIWHKILWLFWRWFWWFDWIIVQHFRHGIFFQYRRVITVWPFKTFKTRRFRCFFSKYPPKKLTCLLKRDHFNREFHFPTMNSEGVC